MKKIKPISIWFNGKIKLASQFYLNAVNVTLGNSAIFYYKLSTDDNENLAIGNISMVGEDYQNWKSDDYAWDWAAKQLNIEYDLDNSVDSNN